MNERPPFALAQAERAQAPIELGAPGTSSSEEEETKFIDIGQRNEES